MRSPCFRRTVPLPVILVTLLLAGHAALAQGRNESPALLIEKAGELLFKAGRYSEALDKFREVVERFGEPEDVIAAARWNIARCHEEMGDDEAALRAFLDFERHARTDRDRQDAAARIAQVRARLQAEVTVEAEPAGATVRVDGEVVGTAPLPQALRLDPGTHEFEFAAEGFRPRVESLDLRPKERRTLRIALEPRVGTIVLSMSDGSTSPAVVLVDDQERYRGVLPAEMLVPPGHHRVVVRVPDRPHPFQQDVQVPDGGGVPIAVRFPEAPAAPLPPVAPPATVPKVAVAKEVSPSISAAVSLSAGMGFVHYQGKTARTHANIEAGVGLRIPSLPWLRPDLSLAASVEAPWMVLVRPGIRWHAGSWPVFVRTAGQAMLAPVPAGGVLVGLGADIPILERLALLIEADVSLWPSALSLVPIEFRVGGGYAF